MNIMFLSMKYEYMKLLWDLIVVGKITNKIFREVITLATCKNRYGAKTYLLKEKEA